MSAPGFRKAFIGPLSLVFFFSGFAALAYQIYFVKKLALVFGSQSSATYTVLAIYMGGMALGSALGANLAKRSPRPVTWYAVLEILVAMYCWATPMIFGYVHQAYLTLAEHARPDSLLLVTHQVWLGSMVLATPTIMMGMTLPLLVRACQSESLLFASLSRLYSSNTLGAAMGALLAGYALIPNLGMHTTLGLSCALDVAVGLVALWLARRMASSSDREVKLGAERTLEVSSSKSAEGVGIGFLALFIVGMVTMLLEVSSIHLLAVVIGNSAYAFSLMVTCFLLGLGLGGRFAKSMLGANEDQQFMRGCLGLCLTLLLSTALWSVASEYFFWLASLGVPNNFWLRELLRAIPATLILTPPAIAIGALYPCTMSMAAGGIHAGIGWPSAVNTIGNIVGVLVAGFILLPHVGGLGITWFAISLSICLFLIAQYVSKTRARWKLMATLGVVILVLFAPKQLDWSRVASGINVYMRVPYYSSGHVIETAASADGGLTAVFGQQIKGETSLRKTLTTNGKFEGNDVMVPGGEMEAQVGLGLVPLLHVAELNKALVIGYGTGMTAMTLNEAGFRTLDVVDLSRDLVRLSDKHFASVNLGVSQQPNVVMYYTDGRNFLSLSHEHYDLIAIQLSSIWFAGAASLYNEEFYGLAANHLTSNGVLKQWFQLHHMTQADMSSIVASASAHFSHIWIYVLGGQGLIVASNSQDAMPSEAHIERIRQIAARPNLQPFVRLFQDGVESVLESNVLEPKDVRKWLSAEHPRLSNDDNLLLEYSTPKGNALGDEVYEANLKFLESWAAH